MIHESKQVIRVWHIWNNKRIEFMTKGQMRLGILNNMPVNQYVYRYIFFLISHVGWVVFIPNYIIFCLCNRHETKDYRSELDVLIYSCLIYLLADLSVYLSISV